MEKNKSKKKVKIALLILMAVVVIFVAWAFIFTVYQRNRNEFAETIRYFMSQTEVGSSIQRYMFQFQSEAEVEEFLLEAFLEHLDVRIRRVDVSFEFPYDFEDEGRLERFSRMLPPHIDISSYIEQRLLLHVNGVHISAYSRFVPPIN